MIVTIVVVKMILVGQWAAALAGARGPGPAARTPSQRGVPGRPRRYSEYDIT